MTEPESPAQVAHRERRKVFEETQQAERRVTIDVNDLIGADGRRFEPTDFDLWQNDMLAGLASHFSETSQADPVEMSEKVLLELARRKAPQVSEGLKRAVYRMMEPMRTVFAGVFYENIHRADLAHALGTSIETIDFLIDVSLELLSEAVEVQIRQP